MRFCIQGLKILKKQISFHRHFKYEDSENNKADRLNTVVLNLHQIKRWAFLSGHSVEKFEIGQEL